MGGGGRGKTKISRPKTKRRDARKRNKNTSPTPLNSCKQTPEYKQITFRITKYTPGIQYPHTTAVSAIPSSFEIYGNLYLQTLATSETDEVACSSTEAGRNSPAHQPTRSCDISSPASQAQPPIFSIAHLPPIVDRLENDGSLHTVVHAHVVLEARNLQAFFVQVHLHTSPSVPSHAPRHVVHALVRSKQTYSQGGTNIKNKKWKVEFCHETSSLELWAEGSTLPTGGH